MRFKNNFFKIFNVVEVSVSPKNSVKEMWEKNDLYL